MTEVARRATPWPPVPGTSLQVRGGAARTLAQEDTSTSVWRMGDIRNKFK